MPEDQVTQLGLRSCTRSRRCPICDSIGQINRTPGASVPMPTTRGPIARMRNEPTGERLDPGLTTYGVPQPLPKCLRHFELAYVNRWFGKSRLYSTADNRRTGTFRS